MGWGADLFRPRHGKGTTFSDLALDAAALAKKDIATAKADIRVAVKTYKDKRFDYYLGQMRSRASTVNGVPAICAMLGVTGVLASTLAIGARSLSLAGYPQFEKADLWLIFIALTAYGVMTALLLFERLTERSGGYFRAVSALVDIRNLWSQYQFADIARELANEDAGKTATYWLEHAHAFCASLDKVTQTELASWQTAFEATEKLQWDAADKGLKSAVAELEKATQRITEATRAAEPATLNLKLDTASTAGEAVVRINGVERYKGSNQLTFAFTGLPQGHCKVEVTFTPSGRTPLVFAESFDLKGGITPASMKLA